MKDKGQEKEGAERGGRAAAPSSDAALEVRSALLESQVIRARLQTCFSPVFTRVSNRADSRGTRKWH